MKLGKRIMAYILLLVMVVTMAAPNVTVNVKAASSSSGFVTTNGTKFWLDGGEFPYCGTNCYYINFKPKEDIDALFDGAEEMGINVIRTWGHLDVGEIQKGQVNDGKQVFSNNADGSGEKDGTYYQYWDADLGKPVVNEGENGLGRLDYVIAQAKKHNIKLILTFTNNWKEFGGMHQYIKWAGLSEHDEFYTNEKVKGWYKDYIKTLLNHENTYTGVQYKDDPTIFAWELSNEPRATSDAKTDSGMLVNWVTEMSAYIKSIDDNHMVSVGDEGFFDYEYETSDITKEEGYDRGWYWHGSEGYDYGDLVAVEDIDFGTPHIYIKDWNMGADMGTGAVVSTEGSVNLWLKHHAEVTHKLDKPIILEEFGFNATKETTLKPTIGEFFTWMFDTLDEYEYAGSNFWMLADYVDGKPYPNYDGYNVYSCTLEDLKKDGITDESSIKLVEERQDAYDIIVEHNKKIVANADNNTLNPGTVKVDLAKVSESSVDMKLQTGASFKSIEKDGKELTKGTDYTVSGDTVTFTESFLSSLEEGLQYVTFYFSQGRNPELVFNVYDSRITSAQLGVTEASFDKNPKASKDVVIPVTINDGGALKAVKLCGEGSQRTVLEQGSDYLYEENDGEATITLSAEYLAGLSGEEAVIEVDYTRGSDPTATILLKDTTGLDIIDNFEDYSDDAALNAKWVKNNYGSHVEGALVTGKSSSTAMEYKYELGQYCGLTKSISSVDASSFDGISFWYQPDGKGQKLTIQMMDAAGNYWEYYSTLDGTEAKTVKVPFSDFKVKEGYGDASADMSTATLKQFSIYVDRVGDDNPKSSLFFDDIELYVESSDAEVVKVTGVTVSEDTVSLEEGETKTIKATVTPSKATNKKVTWSSDDESVATVTGGKITAKKAGTATITAKTADGGFTAECKVTVTAKATQQDPTTQAPAEDTTKDPTTQAPAEDTTKDPTTQAPTEDTTKDPTTQAPAEDTTKDPTTEQPADEGDDKLVYLLDDFSTYTPGEDGIVNNWKPLEGWQYRAGDASCGGDAETVIAYDEEKEALKVDLDYSADTDQSWSEAKINTWTPVEGIDISETNQLRFDMTYPKEYEGFGVKIFANNYTLGSTALVDGEASIKDRKDNGDGTITATIKMNYKKGITTPLNSICIGFVGKYSDFVGSIYVDNVGIWTVSAGVKLPETNGEVTKVDLAAMPESVVLSDSKATKETAAAFAYLQGVIADSKVLFGHQNDNSRMVASSESDTKDITGSYSALIAYDTLALTGSELGVSMEEGYESTLASAKKAAEEGAIISLSTHLPNFETMLADGSSDFSEYGFESSKDLSGNCAENCLPGKKCNDLYNQYLDIIVKFAKDLDGTPVVFRPLHENNGGWFWWGSSTNVETYKALYRYTEEYLQSKGVHNFIYEYSPNGPIKDEEEFLQRYPGDEYVDIFGFDFYDDCATGAEYSDAFEKNLDTSCQVISKLAKERNKVAVIAETGVRVTKENGDSNGLLEENNPILDKGWYEMVNDVAERNDIAYFLLWANFSNQNFYVPYLLDVGRSHELGPDFVDFYNSESSVFADGTNYKEALAKEVTTTSYDNVAGYMIDPINFQEVLEPTTFHAGVKNAKEVTFVIYRTEDDENPVIVKTVKNEAGIYEAAITEEVLAEIGDVEIATVQLKGDDTVIATAKYVSFNIEKAKQPAGMIDNFDYYYGDQEYLESKYCNANSAGGCSSSVAITKKNAKDGTFAGAFSYVLNHVSSGTEVYTGTGRNLEVTDYSKDANGNETNAISMWVTPDGEGQKMVFQIVSGGYAFEAYLTDFMSTKQAQYVTIPFSAMKPKVSGKKVDPSNITAMYFYCNSIRKSEPYTVDSTIYFDKIKAIKADETKIADVARGSYVLSDTQLDGEQDEERDDVAVTGVTLSSDSETVEVGKTVTLKAEVAPEEATNTAVTWTSSDETVAVVSANGTVTAKAEGTATITVTTVDGGKTATCEITVIKKQEPDATTQTPAGDVTTQTPAGDATTQTPAGDVTTQTPAGDATTQTPAGDVTTQTPAGDATTQTPAGDATTQTPNKDVEVTSIILSDKTVTLKLDEEYALKADVYPENATDKTLTWESEDDTIASVDAKGNVTAFGVGTTTITVTASNGKKATCKVTVTQEDVDTTVKVTGVILNTHKWSDVVGATLPLTATISPEEATNKTLQWESSDESVVIVDDEGNMQAVGAGEATVIVTTKDGGFYDTCKVTISKEEPSEVLVESITLDKATYSMKPGDEVTLHATIAPSNATNQNVEWILSKEGVVIVDANGTITALAEGSVTVTAMAKDGSGKKAVCKITVVDTEEEIAVNNIIIAQENVELPVGEELQLVSIITPINATNQKVTWDSDNKAVVTVDNNGKITAVGAGETTVTAKTEDGGKKAVCKVTVVETQKDIAVTDIILDYDNVAMKPGDTKQLSAIISPANATNQQLTWTSSKPELISVDRNGKVTAFAEGEATITVTTSNGKIATCNITVAEEDDTVFVTGVTLNEKQKEVTVGETFVLKATVSPEDATNKAVIWNIENSDIVEMDADGNVIAKAEGTTVITVTTKDGTKMASCTVVVKAKEDNKPSEDATTEDNNDDKKPSEDVTTEDNNDDKKPSEDATTEDKNDDKKPSGDAATEDQNKDNNPAQNTTQTQPAATTQNTNTTQANTVPVTSIELLEEEMTISAGQTAEISPLVLPYNATDKSVTYVSSDTTVALVDAAGVVTAVKPGVAQITLTAGGKTAVCQVVVTPVKVKNLKKTKTKANQVTLSWKKVSGATGYKVYKYDKKTKKYKLYKTVKSTKVTVKKLTKATSYKFKVRAYKKTAGRTIYGTYSKVLTVKTKK